MEEAYRAAGKILPMITTFHMPIHPSLSYWIEISTGAALFGEHNYNSYFGKITYQDSEPSDSGLFYGISEYARDVLAHKVTGRYSPLQVAQWLDTMAQDVTGSLAAAEDLDGGLSGQKEYGATKADMLMQAYLAQYHAEKTRAAYALSLYELTRDAQQLKNAHYFAVLAEKTLAGVVPTGQCLSGRYQCGRRRG